VTVCAQRLFTRVTLKSELSAEFVAAPALSRSGGRNKRHVRAVDKRQQTVTADSREIGLALFHRVHKVIRFQNGLDHVDRYQQDVVHHVGRRRPTLSPHALQVSEASNSHTHLDTHTTPAYGQGAM